MALFHIVGGKLPNLAQRHVNSHESALLPRIDKEFGALRPHTENKTLADVETIEKSLCNLMSGTTICDILHAQSRAELQVFRLLDFEIVNTDPLPCSNDDYRVAPPPDDTHLAAHPAAGIVNRSQRARELGAQSSSVAEPIWLGFWWSMDYARVGSTKPHDRRQFRFSRLFQTSWRSASSHGAQCVAQSRADASTSHLELPHDL
jgi:hypothetical protein